MKRRNYIQTVGGIALTAQAGVRVAEKVRSSDAVDEKVRVDDDVESERTPIYYTVSIPELEHHLLHISIPMDTLESAEYLRVISDSRISNFNIVDIGVDDQPWQMLNFLVQTEDIESVELNANRKIIAEAKQWDSFQLEKVALLHTASASHGLLEIVGDGQSVSVEAGDESWIYGEVEYARSRIETTDPGEIFIESKDEATGEIKTVPVFDIDTTQL